MFFRLKIILALLLFLVKNNFIVFSQEYSLDNQKSLKFLSLDTNSKIFKDAQIYFNPYLNDFKYNRFAYTCEKYVNKIGDFNLYIVTFNKSSFQTLYHYNQKKIYIQEGEHYYFNTDSLLIMSGYFKDNVPHGIFWLYCDKGFPYCTEVSDFPVRLFVFYKGKKQLDIKLDEKGQPVGSGHIKRKRLKWID